MQEVEVVSRVVGHVMAASKHVKIVIFNRQLPEVSE